MNMRVALVTSFVSPYRRPVFERLAAASNWTFRVMTCSGVEFDRNWAEVESHILAQERVASRTLRIKERRRGLVTHGAIRELHIPSGLIGSLRRFGPDVVITGDLGPTTMLAWIYCALFRRRLVIWTYPHRGRLASAPAGPKPGRWLLRRATTVVGMGIQTREVLTAWGVKPDQIFDAPNAADTATLLARAQTMEHRAAVESIRATYGKGGRLMVVASRLIPEKGVAEIVEAFAALSTKERDNWRLVIVGDGPQADALRHHLPESVALAGMQPAETMADWYVAADLNCLPCLGEPWGLVVNEAMALGAPTLCSVHAGCCDDLILEGVTGFRFDPKTPLESRRVRLAEVLKQTDHAAIGEAGREHIQAFSAERMAQGLIDAVHAARDPASRFSASALDSAPVSRSVSQSTPPPNAHVPAALPSDQSPILTDGPHDMNHEDAASRTKLAAVCIATYRRPDMVQRLLDALGRLQVPEGWQMEVRLVNNDPDAAHDTVESGLPRCPFNVPIQLADRLVYTVEPRRNIAHARNAGLELGAADAFLFIDDDEVPAAGWLIGLISRFEHGDADAAFGPVVGRLPEQAPVWMSRGGFFDKPGPDHDGPLNWNQTRTSSTLVGGGWINPSAHGGRAMRFDSEYGISGGSDVEFFKRLQRAGGRLVHCRAGLVYEDAEPHRCTLKAMTARRHKAGAIYTRLLRDGPSSFHSLPEDVLRFAYRGGRAMGLMLTGLPGVLMGRPERWVRGWLTLAMARGGWAGRSAAHKIVRYPDRKDETKVEPKTSDVRRAA